MAENLAQNQRFLGQNTDLLVATSSNLRSEPLRQPLVTLAAAVDNYILKKPDEPHQFSVTRSSLGSPVNRLLESKDPIQVAHLHWVEGFVNQENLVNFVKQEINVVWTLHDMVPFTGGCHSNNECEAHSSGCQTCPLARGEFAKTIERNLQAKLSNKLALGSISLVAPSEWIATQAQKSKIFSGQEIKVISNPINSVFFESRISQETRSLLHIPREAFVVCVVARDLDDPLKGIRSLTKVVSTLGEVIEQETVFVFVGKASQKLRNEFSSVRFTGPLTGEDLANYLSASDILVSTSKAESAGQTVQEAAALGTPSVVFSNPGLLSTIVKDSTAIAVSNDKEMASALISLANNRVLLAELGYNAKKLAVKRHNPRDVAQRYLDLYHSKN